MPVWHRAGHLGWEPRVYEWWFTRNPLQALIRARETRAVQAALAPLPVAGGRVLELGCGTGHHSLVLARAGAHVDAVDAEPAMLTYAAARTAAAGLAGRISFQRRLLPAAEPRPGHYDGVLAVGLLNYLEDLPGALSVGSSALRPEGWLVFTVPLRCPGGRLSALGESLGRRRAWLRTEPEVRAAARASGLTVDWSQRAGLGRRGLTLVVRAHREPAEPGGAA